MLTFLSLILFSCFFVLDVFEYYLIQKPVYVFGKVKGRLFIGDKKGTEELVGMEKDLAEIESILKGNTCGMRSTSCADQLARAIKEVLGQC